MHQVTVKINQYLCVCVNTTTHALWLPLAETAPPPPSPRPHIQRSNMLQGEMEKMLELDVRVLILLTVTFPLRGTFFKLSSYLA